MAFEYTFASLKSTIRTILDRQDIDGDLLEFGVYTAFQRIQRSTRLPSMEMSQTIVQAAGLDYFPVPENILEIKHVLTDRGPLIMKTLDWITAQPESTGVPLYFARSDEIYQLYPVPAEETRITLIYYAQFTDLLSGGETNNLITIAYDVLLYGALSVLGELYVDERVSQWESRFQQEVEELRLHASDFEMHNGLLAVQPPVGSSY
jgi:hypothetical protein